MTTLVGATDEQVDAIFARQLHLCHPKELEALGGVLLIGAGGIGSWTGLGLAKMGLPSLTVMDFDSVEVHNQPNQLYGEAHIGMLKVEALSQVVDLLAGTCMVTGLTEEVRPFVHNSPITASVVVSGVDSMKARKAIWELVKSSEARHYIDARMGARVLRIFTVEVQDEAQQQRYEDTLFDDEGAEEAPCTERSIVYTPMLTAALICDNVKKLATGEDVLFDETFDFVLRIHLT